jgi:hypothetical protein
MAPPKRKANRLHPLTVIRQSGHHISFKIRRRNCRVDSVNMTTDLFGSAFDFCLIVVCWQPRLIAPQEILDCLANGVACSAARLADPKDGQSDCPFTEPESVAGAVGTACRRDGRSSAVDSTLAGRMPQADRSAEVVHTACQDV